MYTTCSTYSVCFNNLLGLNLKFCIGRKLRFNLIILKCVYTIWIIRLTFTGTPQPIDITCSFVGTFATNELIHDPSTRAAAYLCICEYVIITSWVKLAIAWHIWGVARVLYVFFCVIRNFFYLLPLSSVYVNYKIGWRAYVSLSYMLFLLFWYLRE